MTFADALRTWHDLFLLAGGGAATLTGLVFVAVSLATGLPAMPKTGERELFVAPILSQFGSAFGLAATSLAPWQSQQHYGMFITLIGASAFVQSGRLLQGMMRRHRALGHVKAPYWIWTGILPFGASLLLIVSGIVTWQTPHRFIVGVAVATQLLDLMGVRNTWQLVMWIFAVRTQHEAAQK